MASRFSLTWILSLFSITLQIQAQVPYSVSGATREHLTVNAGNFQLHFSRVYCGALLDANLLGGQSIGNEWAGSGLCTWHWNAGGQDPTATSPDGVNHAAAHTPDRHPAMNYNAKQSRFEYEPDGDLLIEINGFAPHFVIDHSRIDHVLASDNYSDTPGQEFSDWLGGWNDCALRHDPGVPIEFDPNGSKAGAWLVGNEKRVPNSADIHRQALARFRDGRISATTLVELPPGEPAAFAGIMFRKEIANANNPSLHDIMVAPGYLFSINGMGQWGATGTGINASGQLDDDIVAKIVQGNPIRLQVLGDQSGHFLNQMALYVEGRLVHWFNADEYGEHVGLMAYSNGGKVRFSKRSFYDLSTQFKLTYIASNQGYVDVKAEVSNFRPASRPQAFFSAVLGSFLENSLTEGFNPRQVWAYRNNGSRDNHVNGRHLLLSDYKAFFAGNTNGSRGVFIENVRSSHPGAHALLQTHAINGEHILHVNALDASAFDGAYVLDDYVSLEYRLRGQVPSGY